MENTIISIMQNEIISVQQNIPKYNIEENIDFFGELKKSLQLTDCNNINEKGNNEFCLITNQSLNGNCVTLLCNHKFNYVPLYNEVKIQKCIKNQAETAKLSIEQLKCPYCRKIQSKLLDYHKELDDICPLKYGVNTMDIRYKITNKCCYLKYTYSDGTKNYCTIEGENLDKHSDGNHYCYSHYYEIKQKAQFLLNQQAKIAKLQEIKEEKMKQKQELNESKKKAKEQAKEQAKIIKSCQKATAKINKECAKLQKPSLSVPNSITNEVISNSTDVAATNVVTNEVISANDANKCIQILKTGISKGCACNKTVHQDNMCKRHYNMSINVCNNTVIYVNTGATGATGGTVQTDTTDATGQSGATGATCNTCEPV